jgi:hypothetical protein
MSIEGRSRLSLYGKEDSRPVMDLHVWISLRRLHKREFMIVVSVPSGSLAWGSRRGGSRMGV